MISYEAKTRNYSPFLLPSVCDGNQRVHYCSFLFKLDIDNLRRRLWKASASAISREGVPFGLPDCVSTVGTPYHLVLVTNKLPFASWARPLHKLQAKQWQPVFQKTIWRNTQYLHSQNNRIKIRSSGLPKQHPWESFSCVPDSICLECVIEWFIT